MTNFFCGNIDYLYKLKIITSKWNFLKYTVENSDMKL